MDPRSWVATEDLMRHYAPGLAAQEPIAEGFWQISNDVSPPLRELADTLCYMEADAQAGGPDPPVDDFWDLYVYHALFTSFLSALALHAPPDDQTAADEATRITRLQETLQRYTDGSGMPTPYTVVGLCYGISSPATLVRHGATLYVAFRASRSPADWALNKRIRLRPVNEVAGLASIGRVHEGFLEAYNGLREELLTRVANYVRNEGVIDVVFCGHSLGGAIAQLLGAAYALMRNNCVRSRVVSFGCPRIGDAPFRDTLKTHINHTRLYVRKDPIPALFRRRYAPHGGMNADEVEGWKLGRRRQAVARSAHQPGMPLFTPVLVFTRHPLTTYATALKDHRDVRQGQVFA